MHNSRGLMRGLVILLLAAMSFALTAAPASGTAPVPAGPAPVAGTDYVVIAGGVPFAPVPGKVEVVEVFGYTCGHCATFEPRLAEWRSRMPDDVSFVAVAAPFGGYWIPYAKAFYAAESMGLTGRTHGAMFRALHEENSLPISGPTPEEIAGFYARFGAKPQELIATMASPAVEMQLERARRFLRQSGVEGTPTLIVNGKYRVLGKSAADTLRITDHLVARERTARRR